MEGKPPPPNPAMPYREDCWSEGATATLIEAWGDRYVELNRGNLRQKHWQEVADTVNSRRGGERRPPRTDVQCKNRIDTLKKKYKIEKTRILHASGSFQSQWPFYSRLDALIGTNVTPNHPQPLPPPAAIATPSPLPPYATKKPPASPPLALPLPYNRKGGTPLPATAAARPIEKRRVSLPTVVDPFLKKRYAVAAAAAAAAMAEEEDKAHNSGSSRSSQRRPEKRLRSEEGGGDGVRELAKAIFRFGEIYEKVEASKQRHILELETQRMEFAKGLEFERMQIIVDSQIELAKIKQSRWSGAGELVGSAVLPLMFEPVLH